MEKEYQRIMVIGATSRNLGKTGLICRLIGNIPDLPVTAIKIKTIRDGDREFHGKDTHLEGSFLIREEWGAGDKDDTVRLKTAGAAQVLYIKTHRNALLDAFKKAMQMVPECNLIIIESNSIVELIRPGIYILIKGADPSVFKPSACITEGSADIILFSDGRRFSDDPESLPIGVSESGWNLIRPNAPTSEP